jgi:membrane protein DedA with SNARE-associated domain
MSVDQLVAYLAELPALAVYAALFGAAFVEYVVPPMPGDTVSFAGVALVAAFGWSLPLVFAVATAGSLAGAATAWAFGRWLMRRAERSERARGWLARLEKAFDAYRRHGLKVLVIHRFFFGFRGALCAAAGASELPIRRVAAAAAVSIVAWNMALFAMAWTVGANLDRLTEMLGNFTAIAGELAAVSVVVAILGVWFWRRRGKLPKEEAIAP